MPTFALSTSCSHDRTDTLGETWEELSDCEKNKHELDIDFIMRLVSAIASWIVLLFTNCESFRHCQIMEAYKERPGGFIYCKPYDRCSVCRPDATVQPACPSQMRITLRPYSCFSSEDPRSQTCQVAGKMRQADWTRGLLEPLPDELVLRFSPGCWNNMLPIP